MFVEDNVKLDVWNADCVFKPNGFVEAAPHLYFFAAEVERIFGFKFIEPTDATSTV